MGIKWGPRTWYPRNGDTDLVPIASVPELACELTTNFRSNFCKQHLKYSKSLSPYCKYSKSLSPYCKYSKSLSPYCKYSKSLSPYCKYSKSLSPYFSPEMDGLEPSLLNTMCTTNLLIFRLKQTSWWTD